LLELHVAPGVRLGEKRAAKRRQDRQAEY
jgi:hypothetical protein